MYTYNSRAPKDELPVETRGRCSPLYFGTNAIFLSIIPYTLVTAIHDTDLHLSLILGCVFSMFNLLVGLTFKSCGGFRGWPYAFEVVMLVVNAVLLGVSYAEPEDIWKYLPFIHNTVYAVFAFASVVVGWPFTIQYVREFVPKGGGSHEKVWRAARWTSAFFTLVFVTNTLIYLIPICRNKYWAHMNALNLLFRIILPIFFFAFAAIFTRAWPVRVLQHLINSQGFDATPRKVMVNPLALEEGYRPPLGGPPQPIHIHAMAV